MPLSIEDSLARARLAAERLASARRDAAATARVLGDADLMRHILRSVQEPKALLAAEQVCQLWHETAAEDDASLWRRFCEQARAYPLLMGMKRAGVSYKQLYAQRATSNRRSKAGGRVVHVPPTREGYQLGVEVRTGAGKLLLGTVTELSAHRQAGQQTLAVLKGDADGEAAKIGLPVDGHVSSMSVAVLLVRKADDAVLVLQKPTFEDFDGNSSYFSAPWERGTGHDAGIFKYVELRTNICWKLVEPASGCGGVIDALDTICLELDDYADEEDPVGSVEDLLQILESPPFARRWIAAPSLRLRCEAAADEDEPSDSPAAGAQMETGQLTVTESFTRKQRRSELEAAAARAKTADAWKQIQGKGTLLSSLLSHLDAKNLRRASEVSRRWHQASAADSVWKLRLTEDFPAAARQQVDKIKAWTLSSRDKISPAYLREFDRSAMPSSWREMYAQRVTAAKEASRTGSLPAPLSRRTDYQVGLELVNKADGNAPLLTALKEISEHGLQELAFIIGEGTAFVSGDYDPAFNVFLVRRSDGKVLTLADQMTDDDGEGSITLSLHGSGDATPFLRAYLDVHIHSNVLQPGEQELGTQLQQLTAMGFEQAKGEKALAVAGGNVQLAMEYILANLQQPDAFWATPAPGTGDRECGGRLVTGVSVSIPTDTSWAEEWCLKDLVELLHLLETPPFAARWA